MIKMKNFTKLALIMMICMMLGIYIEHIYLHIYGVIKRPVFVKMDRAGTNETVQHMKVLVTGGAGFIGFHLAQTLAKQKLQQVVVIDNFNDYYDVRLKMDRAYELDALHIPVYNDDICNLNVLYHLFERYKFTHVAHLAAQAGVRYSLQNPLAYVKANIECQVKLLEVIKHYPEVKLVYASSSSVYGKHSTIPFNLKADTDFPSNMYAVTKKTDELLGYQYCETFNITSIGLRFFTVYGPWGRPDMAVYRFADNMVQGKTVPLYYSSNQLSLARDFTYVDDIISGIVAALQYEPTRCGERFNLGFGGPVKVADMLDLLQRELNVTAKIEHRALPITDLIQTWADISVSIEMLQFKPNTSLKQGIPKFVKWYKSYMMNRKAEINNNASITFYKRLTEERRKRQNMNFTVPQKGTPILQQSKTKDNQMHIAVSTDHNDILGIPTLLNSLLNTSSRPFVFHIIIVNFTKDTMLSYLQCHQFHGLQPNQVEIHEFTSNWLDKDYLRYINVQMKHFKQHGSKSNHESQKGSHGNFARFFFHRLMPNVNKVIYLDCDTVANNDVSKLWDSIPRDKVVGGIHKYLSYSSKAKKIYNERYKSNLPREDTFNAGVFTMNLDIWRANEQQIDQNIRFWMTTCVKSNGDLWKDLTQPLMHFGFAGRIRTLNWKEYNLNMLGVPYKMVGRRVNVASGVILHYNGPLKPWMGEGDYLEYWTRYKPSTCSDRGTCTQHKLLFSCMCRSGYEGDVCQMSYLKQT